MSDFCMAVKPPLGSESLEYLRHYCAKTRGHRGDHRCGGKGTAVKCGRTWPAAIRQQKRVRRGE